MMIDESKSQTPPERSTKSKEENPPKVKMILGILGGLFFVLVLIGVFLPRFQPASIEEPGSHFFSKIQKLSGGGMSIQFPISRDLPGGASLQDWLDTVPSKDKIQSVHAESVATYFLDAQGDWDAVQKNGRWVVTAPWPELRDLPADGALRVDPPGDVIPEGDRQMALDLLQETVPAFLRQEEEGRRAQRLEEIRAKVKMFSIETLQGANPENVDVFFSGEGSTAEDSSGSP